MYVYYERTAHRQYRLERATMTNPIYTNPPLVELISELRWGPQAGKAATDLLRLQHQSKDEEVLMQFAAIAASQGYARVERLVPHGFPLPPGLVACRLRPTDVNKKSPLFQLGRGIFTVNGLPPEYRSWADFTPVIQLGVDALFRAYEQAKSPPPTISTAVVRYIDAFKSDLTDGRSLLEFLDTVFGVGIRLPNAITGRTQDAAAVVPTLRVDVPLSIGMMTVTFGRGMRENEEAVILDTAVTVQRDIGSSAVDAVAALSEARQVIHELFRSLTKPLHEKMGPT